MRSQKAQERRCLLNIRLAMISRCYDPSDRQYKDYGGRGIVVCDRWLASPRAFVDDVWPRPEGMTLDRRDNDSGYGPNNFRWATRSEQVRNRRNNRWIEWKGRRLILKDVCAELRIPYVATLKRLQRGWVLDEALTVPFTRANRGQPRGRAA